jgi:hypothetical protein
VQVWTSFNEDPAWRKKRWAGNPETPSAYNGGETGEASQVNFDHEIIVEHCEDMDLSVGQLKVPSEFKTSRVTDSSPMLSARQSAVPQSEANMDGVLSNNHS